MTAKLKDNWGELVYSIIDEARSRFAACGAESDFCLQHHTGTSIVFGGTNRVIWTAVSGYRPDPDDCTKRFLRQWQQRYGGTPGQSAEALLTYRLTLDDGRKLLIDSPRVTDGDDAINDFMELIAAKYGQDVADQVEDWRVTSG